MLAVVHSGVRTDDATHPVPSRRHRSCLRAAALDAYTLASPALSVAIDRKTGRIVELVDRQSSRDFCRLDDKRFGMIGGAAA